MASYGNNDSKFSKEDVIKTVQELTSAENVDAGTVTDESANITYKSDGKNCSVEINASENTYIVKCGDKQVFPKN
ncbi:conserved hypothetical protein [Clostridium carboxidivorans P7]|uniref:Uncharacterized protein n=2 Tax=Clostridium TaxID=1485 RepID=C6PQT8_9CLOT|nr:hypothetical protein [Clostridium carboxidivorans]EET88460.1 conserved hypothetical protein [Clostridium carboxidivorans P7]